MAMGMTYEQFWDGDNQMPKMFRKAHELKMDETNELAWLQGAYVYHAINSLAPALKAFSKGRPQEYIKHPIGWEERKQAPAEKEKASDNRAKQWLEMWAINFNEKFDKKQAEKGGEVNG